MWDGRFGGKGCEVWATKRIAREGVRGGAEGGRGGEGAGQKRNVLLTIEKEKTEAQSVFGKI